MQQLFYYAEVDELCATTALYACSRHFWYLTGELIPLCSFSNKLLNYTDIIYNKELILLKIFHHYHRSPEGRYQRLF